MGEVVALMSCKGCIHVLVCRYRCSVGGKNCTHKLLSKNVRQVVRGRWDKDTPFGYKCSLCGCIMPGETNFCTTCGADMRGGGEYGE